jgi:protein-S-isoprenylcysteine O-methyltransferase Ste14
VNVLKLTIFLLVSIPILLVSRRSFRRPASHGFFRFFAFETDLLLLLLNAEYWFRDALAPRQIVSWLLLLSSLVLALHGFYLLRKLGNPKGGIDSTRVHVTSGAYRYIRHPLYSSLLLFAWGVCLKSPSLPAVGLAVGASAYLTATVLTEERQNLMKFGAQYAAYMKASKRFIPFIY